MLSLRLSSPTDISLSSHVTLTVCILHPSPISVELFGTNILRQDLWLREHLRVHLLHIALCCLDTQFSSWVCDVIMALCGIIVEKVTLMKCTTVLGDGMQVTTNRCFLFHFKSVYSAVTVLCPIWSLLYGFQHYSHSPVDDWEGRRKENFLCFFSSQLLMFPQAFTDITAIKGKNSCMHTWKEYFVLCMLSQVTRYLTCTHSYSRGLFFYSLFLQGAAVKINFSLILAY